MSDKNTNEPKITFHHQPDGEKSIGKRISDLAETADKIWIASAFLTEGGLKLLGNVSEKCKEINIICAMHGGASDIKALEDWVNENIGIKKKVSVYDKRMFHPKIYYFVNGNETTVLIGSGNFTQNGTSKNGNVETMVELKNNYIPKEIMKFLADSFKDGINLKEFWEKYPNYNYTEKYEPRNELEKEVKKDDIIDNSNTISFERYNDAQTNFFNHRLVIISSKYRKRIDSIFGNNVNEIKKWNVYIQNHANPFKGKIRKQDEGTKVGYNYRIQILGLNKEKLKTIINEFNELNIKINLGSKIIEITKIK
ncbi:MAG: NgoFVII family restriction endonuclease [Candidatus Marinimicrobia bacterium]|nr:NgoFVII family restriction endonuclease [Candidatus Neomarinimicrobiota bacterium]